VVYLYDGWQVVEERELDGATWEARRQFVYGGVYIDEPLIFDKDTDADGDCVDAGGSSRYFYAQQANFNVVAVTSGDGTVVEKMVYTPYGEAVVTVQGGQSASGNPYLFQGRRWDDEADLYYFRNRSLNPRLGRFIQRDPIRYVDSGAAHDLNRSATAGVTNRAGNRSPDKMRVAGNSGTVHWYEYVGSDVISFVDPVGLARLLTKRARGRHLVPHSAVVVKVKKGNKKEELVLSWEGQGWKLYPYKLYMAKNRAQDIWESRIDGLDDQKIYCHVLADMKTDYKLAANNCAQNAQTALRAGGKYVGDGQTHTHPERLRKDIRRVYGERQTNKVK
jgi:RHS repeat-associated protein